MNAGVVFYALVLLSAALLLRLWVRVVRNSNAPPRIPPLLGGTGISMTRHRRRTPPRLLIWGAPFQFDGELVEPIDEGVHPILRL